MSDVQSVVRAFAIVRALGLGPAGVTELAERVGLPKSTVSRMLSTLETIGAVEQPDGGGPYRLGPLAGELAASLATAGTITEVALPYLHELTETIGEAAGLSVLDGRDTRCVLEVKPENEIQVRDWTGTSSPLHTVPAGLLFLSRFTRAELDAYLAGDLVACTEASITDRRAIRRRLPPLGQAGVAWVFGEFNADLNSVGAPVVDRHGRMVAAIHVHGPSFRYPAEGRAEQIARQVREMAGRLSTRLAAGADQLASSYGDNGHRTA